MAFMILYMLLIFAATMIGSICGMGGGVIIKPVLDALSEFSTFQISLISTCCMFAMSISSLVKHYLSKTKIALKRAAGLAVGSIGGGLLGVYLFSLLKKAVVASLGEGGEYVIKIVQNSVLACLLILVLFYMIAIRPKGKTFHFDGFIPACIVSCCLGTFSAFLDIGGGPINVCVICLFFGVNTKEASVNSMITIFFAQGTKLLRIILSGSLQTNVVFDENFKWFILALMVAAAVVGGLTGAVINKKISVKNFDKVYYGALIMVICLNIYNIISNAVLLNA